VALDERVEVKTHRLVVEYNIWRPVEREWEGFGADPALTIIRAAAAKRACILVAPREVVIERLRARQPGASFPGGKVEWLTREYSRPGRYRSRYERWISYCKANGFDVAYLDVGSRQIKSVSEDEALHVIGDDS
jgi:hypothetical protein